MKKLYYYLAFLLVFLTFSCAKDKGNYDYNTGEQIEISGIEPLYNAISQKDTLKISPIAKSNKEGELEYRWGIYETNVQGRAEPLDTIARTQSLNYFVDNEAKSWVLVFIVKNKKTGFTKFQTSSLAVSTLFTRGWYVLKDDGLNSDLDLFITPKNNIVDGVLENVYSGANGKKLEGTGVFLSFATNYKSNILNPSLFSNTRTLLVSTSKDLQTIGVNTMKYIRDKESIFLGGNKPVAGSVALFNGSSATYAFNEGQLYNIYAMSSNAGQFGNKVMIDGTNSPYRLSKYMLSSSYGDPILFDDMSSSFVTLGNGSGSTLTTYSNATGNSFNTSNNNQKMLFMGIKAAPYLPAPDYYFKTIGYTILQDKTDPSLKSLCLLEKNKFVLNVLAEEIDPGSKLYNADLHTLIYEDENLMYFVNNNQVYSRNLSNGFEQLQFTLPGAEQAVFIKHIKYNEGANTGYSFNYLIIGSKSGSDYKIRMFNKSAGNLDAEPVQTISGKGTARAMMYVSPSVSESSFPNSY